MAVVHHCPIGPSEQDRLMSVVVHLLAGGGGGGVSDVMTGQHLLSLSSVSPRLLTSSHLPPHEGLQALLHPSQAGRAAQRM